MFVGHATPSYENYGPSYDKTEHRGLVEGILYRMRAGVPWRDLPSEFGEWSSVYRRFNLLVIERV